MTTSTDTTTHLRTLSDEPLPARIVAAEAGDGAVTLTLRLAYADWRRALDEGLFHLDGEREPPGFEPARDVQLTLRLRGHLAERAGDATADGVAAALADPGSPLGHSEAWLALDMVQDLDPPPELEGDVSYLHIGAKTHWAAVAEEVEAERSAVEEAPVGGVRARLEAFLEAEAWPYVAVEDDLLRFPAGVGESRSWVALARLDEAAGTCTLISVHPRKVPAASRARAALWLSAMSRQLVPGAFDFDPSDGEVRYRITFAASDRQRIAAGVHQGLRLMAASFDDVAALAADPDGETG